MRTVSFRVPAEMADTLARVARHQGQKQSALLRAALNAYLDGRSNRKQSFLEAAGKLIGSLDGPGDLSMSKERLERYGR